MYSNCGDLFDFVANICLQ